MKKTITLLAALAASASLANAATYFAVLNGNIETEQGWLLDGSVDPVGDGRPNLSGDIGIINTTTSSGGGNAQVGNLGLATIRIQTGAVLTLSDANITSGSLWSFEGGSTTATGFLKFDSDTFNFSGGTVTAQAGIRFDSSTIMNIGGSAEIVSNAFDGGNGGEGFVQADVDFASGWSGSWTNTAFDGDTSAWAAQLVDRANKTFDGTDIDATVFANNFVVSNNGQTLSALSAVPEPSSTALLGLAGFGLILRRRR